MTHSLDSLSAPVTPGDIMSRAAGFLFDVALHEEKQGFFAQAQFDITAFHPDLFKVLAVDFPTQLASAVSKRQAEFLAGRLVARMAMKDAHDLKIAPDRSPIWPSALNGSITHSHGRCAALVTNRNMLCGIDLEQIAQSSALDAILQRCVSPQERIWIDHQNIIPPDILATLVFSAKESVYKALFPIVGRFFGFECAEVLPRIQNGTLFFRLTEDLDAKLPKGFEMSVSSKISEDFVLTKAHLPRI